MSRRQLKIRDLNISISCDKFKAQVFSANGPAVDGLKTRVRRFLVDQEPRYYFEPLANEPLIFMKLTSNNQLKGMFLDGHLVEKNDEIEKIYHLSKIDLMPKILKI